MSKELFNAVKFGQRDTIQQLVRDGADINAKDQYGWTPLHFAVSYIDDESSFVSVRTLIECGARVDIKDKMGATPLDIYRNDERKDVLMEALREREAKETKAHLEQAVGMREAKAEAGTQEEVQVIKQRRKM